MSASNQNRPDHPKRPHDDDRRNEGADQADNEGADQADNDRDDEEIQRLIADALGTYSADGQADDATGNDAGAEAAFGHGAHPRGVKQPPPSPDGPRIGPS